MNWDILFLILMLIGCLFFTFSNYIIFDFKTFIIIVIANIVLGILSVIIYSLFYKMLIFEILGLFLLIYFLTTVCNMYLYVI